MHYTIGTPIECQWIEWYSIGTGTNCAIVTHGRVQFKATQPKAIANVFIMRCI